VHTINKKLILLVFCCFYLINIVCSAGHLDVWDGIEAFLVTESMALKHTAKLDPSVPSVQRLHFNVNYTVAYYEGQFEGRHFNQNISLKPVYTVSSLLISAIGVPFYYLALAISVSPVVMIGLFVNSLLIALTSLVIFCFSIELYGSSKIGFVLSLIFNVCSFVLPYTNTYWVQPLQALTIVASTYFIYKSVHYSPLFICNYVRDMKEPKKIKNTLTTAIRPRSPALTDYLQYHNRSYISQESQKKGHYFGALGGLFLGLSVFAHPTSIVLLPGFLGYCIVEMRKDNIKKFFSFVTMLSIVLICIAAINYLRFNSITEFGYGTYSSLATHNGWRGLIGLLISPGAGLFVYFPLSILLPWAVKNMKKQNKKHLMYLFLFIIIVNWLDVGTLSFNFEPFSWWGLGWGPRYFVVLLPIVTLMIGSILIGIDKRKLLRYCFVALCISGFCINMLGVLVWISYDQAYLTLKEKIPNDKLWNLLIWHPFYSPIVVNAKSLLDNFVVHIPVEQYKNTFWHWVSYGLVPCAYDNYIYCKLGLVYTIVIIAEIAFVVLDILVEIHILKPQTFSLSYLRNSYLNKLKKFKRMEK
jgi:hypothetical protein